MFVKAVNNKGRDGDLERKRARKSKREKFLACEYLRAKVN